jgi:hypothetical protein
VKRGCRRSASLAKAGRWRATTWKTTALMGWRRSDAIRTRTLGRPRPQRRQER